jgi:hypothetical protein
MTVYITQTFDATVCAQEANAGKIVVIKNFMDADSCYAAIKDASTIELENLVSPVWSVTNFKSVWPDNCKFDYYKLSDPVSTNSAALTHIYEKMKRCMILLHGPAADKPKYHLELLHYYDTCYFSRHNHEKDPQFFGLILQLSKLGTDYSSGGTVFYTNNEIVDINHYATQGDMIMFKYDIGHEVTPVAGINGRWSAVLPYY